MKTDTAHAYWGTEWAKADGTTKWEHPEAEVVDFARTLPAGAAVLDLGAGVGRHALALARQGLSVTGWTQLPRGSPKSLVSPPPKAWTSTPASA